MNHCVIEMLRSSSGDKSQLVLYRRMMAVFIKISISVVLINILAIILLPSLIALLILALSTMTLNRPLNCVMAILKLQQNLQDSMVHFNYHRVAYDKALAKLQELFLLSQSLDTNDSNKHQSTHKLSK